MVHNPEIIGGRVGCTLFHAKNNVFYRVGGVLMGSPPRRIDFQQRKTTFGLVSSETVLTDVERSEGPTISSPCVSRRVCQSFTGSNAGGESDGPELFASLKNINYSKSVKSVENIRQK